MNRKLVIGVILITILVSTSLLGCASNNTVQPAKSVIPQTQIQPESSDTKNTTNKNDIGNATGDPVSATTTVPVSQFKYAISTIPSDTKIVLNTPWELSPLKRFSGTIEGKGDKAQEEGYSHIIIKDEKSGNLTKLTLENEEKNKITAKNFEWIDESEMFVIIGFPHGTVSKGGKIYKLNIKTGEMVLYTDTKNKKEEFTAVHKTASGYTFDKYVYEDDNFMKGHIESGILLKNN